jgi:hypothetical protein
MLINVKETIEYNSNVILVIKLYLDFVQSIFVKFSAIFQPDEFWPSGLSAIWAFGQMSFWPNEAGPKL